MVIVSNRFGSRKQVMIKDGYISEWCRGSVPLVATIVKMFINSWTKATTRPRRWRPASRIDRHLSPKCQGTSECFGPSYRVLLTGAESLDGTPRTTPRVQLP